MDDDKEISPVGLFFSIVALILFTFLAYKVIGGIGFVVGPIVALMAVRPAYDARLAPNGNKNFLFIRNKDRKDG